MPSGQSLALSSGSLPSWTPSLQVFWDRDPHPQQLLSTQGTEGQSREVHALGLWRRPTLLVAYSEEKDSGWVRDIATPPPAGRFTQLLPVLSVLRVEGAFPLITQQGRADPILWRGGRRGWGGVGSHVSESSLPACRSAPSGASWDNPPREGCQRDLCLGRGAASQQHLLKLRKRSQSPCVCPGNKERNGKFSHKSRRCRPVSRGCSSTMAPTEDRLRPWNRIFTPSTKVISLPVR